MAIDTNKFLNDLQKDLTDMTSEELIAYAQEAGFAVLQGQSKSRCNSCRYLYQNGCQSIDCCKCPLEEYVPEDDSYWCLCMNQNHDKDGTCPYYEKWEGEELAEEGKDD